MAPDFGDEGSRLEEKAREEVLALRQAASDRARRIDAALPPAVVAPQDCVECGEPINLRRLELYPRTRRCADCASDIERPGGAR